ncbi:6-phosphogluconolactonase [Candidatus Manganitrophus noduliformans]|uniref:6-phosphogluconolactonase n=1 Tax=Candidatus Manganitrophus noduliformans TaxID=2606439 RepID=A0A7X6DNP7_9BACT|nr:6-phosphogluconolactonase [Candidatus Manganitrophus noduliformans]NKE70263.1 6-phosphogluconolactonase [Candidatus Manganitrophus noduliformans]
MDDQGMEVKIARDLEDLSEKAAEFVLRFVMDLLKGQESVSIALAGGATPKFLYERLAIQSIQQKIPWSRVHLFWGDERCVPPEDPDSNYRMADATLISQVPIPMENVHRMPGEKAPEAAAEEYEKTLRAFFGSSPEWPRFDLVLLGVGADGHTASLFPGSPALKEKKRWVIAPYVEKLKVHRLTLTLPVFNHAALVLFLISGREKAPIVRALLSSVPLQIFFPAQMIRPVQGRRLFFLDPSAASLLDQGRGG